MRPNYTLPRLYLDEKLVANAPISLSREHTNYLGKVLRKREGDRVRVFNARDGEWAAAVGAVGKRSLELNVVEKLRDPVQVPDIRLLFSPVRKHRNAFIIEKATELGIRTLQPVRTARTQFGTINLDRARAQIIEAAEQTERMDLPAMADVKDLAILPLDRPVLFADEAGDAHPALEVIRNLSAPLDILIGPEGGFDPVERERLRGLTNVNPVTLGPRILRADTAALSLVTLVQAIIGDWEVADIIA